MKELLDTEVREIRIDPEGQYIAFRTGFWDENDNNWTVYEAQGDCCSSHWIQSIENPEALLGADRVQMLDQPDPFEAPATRQDFDQIYTIHLGTKKGVCTITHRNSSNGYYGGELAFRDGANRKHCTLPVTTTWPATNQN
jgi:hypothetical protein